MQVRLTESNITHVKKAIAKTSLSAKDEVNLALAWYYNVFKKLKSK